ncbi:Helix-turn-helix type 11 domain protein [Beutenbergia cavernae DSM 12333]|uniref:Helix-turn-helix type 11 domain protein n=1 Tax=Beutenbergia cavernae (strain ATCC BAA-8 / DSM 12333 / CCUG 43141 / JCM 11478 / NBRC 16432 / NCIMB 13614 / HKI 0122) TaxID=471853 RepID=C5BVH8_BEUC1|nr:WYL domain-containing protein [Beutenbergia cavernae]ACQ78418.1 Helix-turn-helix type 11 domain protein [Beutenbergia cavernae DSM 12333]
MADTAARMLDLLALLQMRPGWSGSELAQRLSVSTRTIRADIERLRRLDYPVEGVRGRAGHYRLGVGAKLPPLLLDDDEAVAVAIGLRAATGLSGVEESTARALAKLEQVMPHQVRRKVHALATATSQGPVNTDSNVADPVVDAGVLSSIAAAIRDLEWLRFSYRDDAADAPPRAVEPYRLVSWQRRWYLVARDTTSTAWATFRVDWMDLRMRTGRHFVPSPLSEAEYSDLVVRTVASTGWAVHTRILVHAPAGEVLARINPAVGVVEPVDAATSVLVTGGDTVEIVAVWIGMLGLDFEVEEPPELVEAIRVQARRYAAAVGDSTT